MCGSPLRIGQSDASPSSGRLRVGEQPIPTLESLLALVAGRVPLLLEVKVDARHLALGARAAARARRL